MKNIDGHIIPESQTHEHERLLNQVVSDLVKDAQLLNNHLENFKRRALNDIAELISILTRTYNIEVSEQDGCVTLMSYDGRYKVVRKISTRMVFATELNAAKIQIIDCISRWPKGRRKNALGLVAYAFKTNLDGQINTAAVLSLFKLNIEDENWKHAMMCLNQAIQTNSTASYIQVYERIGMTDEYQLIPLDIAAVNV